MSCILKAEENSANYIVRFEVRVEPWGDDRYGGYHAVKGHYAYFKVRRRFLWWTWYIYEQIGGKRDALEQSEADIENHRVDIRDQKRSPQLMGEYN